MDEHASVCTCMCQPEVNLKCPSSVTIHFRFCSVLCVHEEGACVHVITYVEVGAVK